MTSAAYSPDGDNIISGSGDYLVNVWDFFPMVANTDFPPDLFVEISFSEENGNGFLDADETGEFHFKLTNKGKGDAVNLRLKMTLAKKNPQLHFKNHSLRHLKSGDSLSFDVVVYAARDVKTRQNVLRIEITEENGHHVDPLEFVFFSQKLKSPKFVLLGVEIDDDDEGSSFGQSIDGKVQVGEQIEATVRIQNQGRRDNPGDAHDVEISLNNQSTSIEVDGEVSFFKKRLELGEVFSFDFVFAVNKTYPESESLLPLGLDIREKYDIATVSDLSLGIELRKKTRVNAPSAITPKPLRLGRAKFEKLGSQTTVVYKKRRKFTEDVEDIPEAKSKRENALAVIIGMPNAENAVNDAGLMKTYFENVLGIPGRDIKVFVQGMNRNDFVSMFEQKIGNSVDENTELFVFYSGHGIVDEEDNWHLLPLDGSTSPRLIHKTCYPLADLYDALALLNARTKTIILNTCFSGKIREGGALAGGSEGKPFPVPADSHQHHGDFTVIASSTGSQTSWAIQDTDYGLFTYYFAAALKGHADNNKNGEVTLGEIRDYVVEKVEPRSEILGRKQKPTFWTSGRNFDKVFVELGD